MPGLAEAKFCLGGLRPQTGGGESLRSPGGLSLLPSMDATLFCGMNLKDLGLQLYEDKTILFHPELQTYHLGTN